MTLPSPRERRHAFYGEVIDALVDAGVSFLVGGGHALAVWTGIVRDSKDLDLFFHPRDFERAVDVLDQAGFRTQVTFTHWLGKALGPGGELVDLIFASGNGACPVDDAWFEHATEATVLGRPVRLVPVEEMLWQKAFILERDRCDVADVAHLLQRRGGSIDWERLLRRFGDDAELLLAHVVLLAYTFPADRGRVPEDVVRRLLDRFQRGPAEASRDLCRGTLVSYGQFQDDLGRGYGDARLPPYGNMTAEQVDRWRDAFKKPIAKRDLPAERPVRGHPSRARQRPTRRS